MQCAGTKNRPALLLNATVKQYAIEICCEGCAGTSPWPFATGPAPRPELCTFLTVQHKLLLKRAAGCPAALRKRMKQQAAEVGFQPPTGHLGCGLPCLCKRTN